MNEVVYSKFEAKVCVEGHFSSETTVYNPMHLLQVALQHALLCAPAEAVTKLVEETASSILHSLSCKRRQTGEVVRLLDDNEPDGYNGLYQIDVGRGEPTDCMRCGNPACNEWPTLLELSPDGGYTGEYAYHVSECQMGDYE